MPKLFGRNFTRRQLLDRVGDISQLMHARRAELSEGFERGADLIEVFNASGLCFSILSGRSLDIASAHYKGMSLCFRGNTGDKTAMHSHPAAVAIALSAAKVRFTLAGGQSMEIELNAGQAM